MNDWRTRLFAVGVAVAAGALAAGCEDALEADSGRSLRPIPDQTLALMDKIGTTPSAPVLIRTYKQEAELEIWKAKSDGQYALLKTYPMCRWSGQLGPKLREGDHQVPEGFYTIAPGQMNPNSHYYLSFNVGYPNAYDRALGRTGGDIMVHGVCSSAGCYLDDRRADRRDLRDRARSVQRRSARDPDAVVPVPDDGREPRQAPARSQHRVLERDQERRRSFRGDEDRAGSAGVRQALRLRRACRPATSTPAPPARPTCSATTRSKRRSPTRRRATTRQWRRWSPRGSSRSRSSTRTAARTPPSPAGRTSTRARPRRSPPARP